MGRYLQARPEQLVYIRHAAKESPTNLEVYYFLFLNKRVVIIHFAGFLAHFLPNNVDIQVGDVLVTSGLDGRFPEGYPVAVVSSVKLDLHDSTPIISATPTADLKRLRYLLLLWNDKNKPAPKPNISTDTKEELNNE